jgi:Mg-chelatase subunit ChlD
MCPETGEIFNLSTIPPPADAVSRLVARPQDSDAEAFALRLSAYAALQKTITPLFEAEGCVVHVDARNDAALIHSEIMVAILHPTLSGSRDLSNDEGDDSQMPSRGVSASADPTAPPELSVELCGSEGGPPGGVNAVVTVNVAELLTYLEGVHSDDDAAPPLTRRDSSREVRIPDRLPADICCVVDVSGSMKSLATYEDSQGKQVNDGLSILDVVKHAVKTVMHILQDQDRLAIVAFSNKASLVLAPINMCETGRQTGIDALDKLLPGGQTNLWDGLLTGMETLRGCIDESNPRRQSLLLLTDGQPNIVPPNGHLSELRDYLDQHSTFNFQLSTFGFGYTLDSALLLELACAGYGTYSFIPDALIVGTNFVNSVANLLCLRASNATINLMLKNGAVFDGPILGGFPASDESWGRRIEFGPLMYGQVRELVAPVKLPEGYDRDAVFVEAQLVFTDRCTGDQCSVRCASNKHSSSADSRTAVWKYRGVDAGHAAVKLATTKGPKEALKDPVFKGLGGWLEWFATQVSPAGADKLFGIEGGHRFLSEFVGNMKLQQDSLAEQLRFASLLGDIGGRSLKALTGEQRFKRWGGNLPLFLHGPFYSLHTKHTNRHARTLAHTRNRRTDALVVLRRSLHTVPLEEPPAEPVHQFHGSRTPRLRRGDV